MPASNIQFSAKGKQPDGKVVNLPPSIALASKGPEVQISVTIADQIAQQLIIQGKQIPPPKAGAAIIDTGASMTCLDEEIAKELQLPVVNVVNLSSASHASPKANVYPIRIQIAGLPLALNPMA